MPALRLQSHLAFPECMTKHTVNVHFDMHFGNMLQKRVALAVPLIVNDTPNAVSRCTFCRMANVAKHGLKNTPAKLI